ncbi:histidine kinase [Halomonas huangheensis]|nr:histidine kinase [Halomonas huangheensis]
MTSIRRYLFRTLALTVAVLTLLVVTAAWLISRHELVEILDAQLSITARGLMASVPEHPKADDYRRLANWLDQDDRRSRLYSAAGVDDANAHSDWPGRLFHHEERKLGLGLWNAAQQPLLIGPGWQKADNAMAAPREEGLAWEQYAGHQWRVLSIFDEQRGIWIRLGIEQEFLDHIMMRIAANHLWPMLLILSLALWWVLRLIRRSLTPIDQLSRQVENRSAETLQHIDVEMPRELHGLQSALNDFIQRLKQTLERERRFTADAAHEMRTPLSVVKIHLDNALAGEHDALPKARQGIERLQRVVEQLLILARFDRQQFAESQPMDLRAVVLDMAAELWPLAQARQQQLEVRQAMSATITANTTEIGILVRNLLDNALRYTPEGGRIEVTLITHQHGITLSVTDNGPGIPEHRLPTITDRFHRASQQTTSGSGLGLSIVVALAERHAATLSLSNADQGGLVATLEWPVSPRL